MNNTHENLLKEGYTATRLLQDEGFEKGFYVAQFEHKNHLNHGKFNSYCEGQDAPMWQISPWWARYDLWDNRDVTADKYTLCDKYGVNYVKYNPEEKSLTLRQNARNIYEGEPHIPGRHNWWPHLLVEQAQYFVPVDKKRNSAAADKMIAEIDVRMLDFKQTTTFEGINVCQFLLYFYLMTDKASGQWVWFGITLFNSVGFSTTENIGWGHDSAAHQYMYGMPMRVVHDGMENSFMPEKGVFLSGEEWKNIRLDVTGHIDNVVEWANRDNIFGVKVTKEDMYFTGANIGFEIHGNYDCTFEFKNFNMVAYNKDKEV